MVVPGTRRHDAHVPVPSDSHVMTPRDRQHDRVGDLLLDSVGLDGQGREEQALGGRRVDAGEAREGGGEPLLRRGGLGSYGGDHAASRRGLRGAGGLRRARVPCVLSHPGGRGVAGLLDVPVERRAGLARGAQASRRAREVDDDGRRLGLADGLTGSGPPERRVVGGRDSRPGPQRVVDGIGVVRGTEAAELERQRFERGRGALLCCRTLGPLPGELLLEGVPGGFGASQPGARGDQLVVVAGGRGLRGRGLERRTTRPLDRCALVGLGQRDLGGGQPRAELRGVGDACVRLGHAGIPLGIQLALDGLACAPLGGNPAVELRDGSPELGAQPFHRALQLGHPGLRRPVAALGDGAQDHFGARELGGEPRPFCLRQRLEVRAPFALEPELDLQGVGTGADGRDRRCLRVGRGAALLDLERLECTTQLLDLRDRPGHRGRRIVAQGRYAQLHRLQRPVQLGDLGADGAVPGAAAVELVLEQRQLGGGAGTLGRERPGELRRALLGRAEVGTQPDDVHLEGARGAARVPLELHAPALLGELTLQRGGQVAFGALEGAGEQFTLALGRDQASFGLGSACAAFHEHLRVDHAAASGVQRGVGRDDQGGDPMSVGGRAAGSRIAEERRNREVLRRLGRRDRAAGVRGATAATTAR